MNGGMRYIHRQADEICRYVESAGLQVMQCSVDGVLPPNIATSNLISDMLVKSATLWGLRLPCYARISKSANAPQLSLPEATAAIENDVMVDQFLIVAYQDGGLISVSGTKLPFQKEADTADWWRP